METNLKLRTASVILGLGIALGGFFPGYYYYLSQKENSTVTVKGLAEMDVKANLAVWNIKFKTTGSDLNAVQQKMENDLRLVTSFLREKGFKNQEIIVGKINTNDLMTNPYRDEKATDSRYILDQTVTVRSENVDGTDAALREIGTLVSQGVIFDSQDYQYPVSYLFTGINQIKPQMLEESTRNAKQAAEEFAKSSDSKVGKIKTANQGVFSILPREQTPGASESAQINKTVRVVSTIVYYLE